MYIYIHHSWKTKNILHHVYIYPSSWFKPMFDGKFTSHVGEKKQISHC